MTASTKPNMTASGVDRLVLHTDVSSMNFTAASEWLPQSPQTRPQTPRLGGYCTQSNFPRSAPHRRRQIPQSVSPGLGLGRERPSPVVIRWLLWTFDGQVCSEEAVNKAQHGLSTTDTPGSAAVAHPAALCFEATSTPEV